MLAFLFSKSIKKYVLLISKQIKYQFLLYFFSNILNILKNFRYKMYFIIHRAYEILEIVIMYL